MDTFRKLQKVCKRRKTFVPYVYWEQAVLDYISCSDLDPEQITDEMIKKTVNDFLNDDEVWIEIDSTIDYFLGKHIEEGKGE